jgi:hypothetical protein
VSELGASRARRAIARVILFSLAAAGCVTQEVVVATTETDGGSHDEHGCRDNTTCAANEFCAKDSCDKATGRCQKRPILCDDTSGPTCGCDGVTYWNDCLRQSSGVRASTLGECISGAAHCDDPSAQACPVAGASCARLLPPDTSCAASPPGDCWVLPTTCPAAGSDQHWSSCARFGACVDVCTAIRAGAPHRLHPGPTCP